MRYNIARLDINNNTKRQGLATARRRQSAPLLIPSNITEENLEQFWKALNHGNGQEEMDIPFDPVMFAQPSDGIEKLRLLSRKGLEEMKTQKEGPKVVWQPKDPFSDD